MSRLVESDIDTLVINMKKYEEEFKEQTGMTMEEIAMMAVRLAGPLPKKKTAVVPVTSGLGIIGGFSDTVCGILRYYGIDAFVTEGTDVAGLQEAFIKGAELVFLADDDVCSAFLITDGKYSDNGYATGIGFAESLFWSMKKNRKDQEPEKRVLVLGLGPVGCAAARHLEKAGCEVWVYDILEEKARKFVQENPEVHLLDDPGRKKEFLYLYDATPSAGVIGKNDVTEKTVIAAPGMPLGVKKKARKKASVIHNPLELGIITMYCECIAKKEQRM